MCVHIEYIEDVDSEQPIPLDYHILYTHHAVFVYCPLADEIKMKSYSMRITRILYAMLNFVS